MYIKSEVEKVALEYFKDSLVANVWMDKYALKVDDTNFIELSPDDTIKRLTSELSRIENKYPNPISYDTIYDLLKNYGKFVFGGSSLFGIGNYLTLSSLGNCFVIDSPYDSYGGIFKTDQELAQLMKRRGGVGVDISTLRSKGAKVLNAANASTGAVSFANRYSNTTREVAQDGRRGALMLSMDIDHKDVGDFISCKDDLTKVTGANISVKVNDNFMHFLTDQTLQDTKTYINVKRVWDKLIHQAWKSAEPGVLFWDKIISESPADCYEGFKTVSTNPCTSGDTLILTEHGYKQISSCISKNVSVWNGSEFSKVRPQITGQTNQWYIITFSDGSELKCTPYHKFYLKNYNDEILASQLVIGDKLQKFIFPIIPDNNKFCKDLYTYGFFCGDGTIKRGEATIDLYGEKKLLLDLLNYRRYRKEKDGVSWKLYLGTKWDKKFVPDSTFSLTSKLTYLAGLLDSDGSLNSPDGSLNISSIDRDFLLNIKYLLNTIGTTGTVSLMKKSGKKLMPNGHGSNSFYNCKNSYRIIINATNVKKLIDIGLKTHRVKLIANPNRNASRFITVTNIELLNVNNELTYCFNEPIKHRGIFNGILTGQCGELPLCPYDSCRLGSINLYTYVVNPFTDNAGFDLVQLGEDTQKIQRLMDDLIDLESEKIIAILDKIEKDPEPIEVKQPELDLWTKIHNKLLLGRRTGLGLMGLADAGAALGLKYGESAFIGLSEEIAKTIALNSYKSSIIMAHERGAFPIWSGIKEMNNPFLSRILEKLRNTEFEYLYSEYGRRNIANLTIAPTGSISMLAGVSSGIEPVFALSYNRKRKVNVDNPNKSSQDKQGDWWETYEVLHSKYIEWYNKYGYAVDEGESIKELSEKSPYYKATAHDIDPHTKIKLQSVIQSWIDHSISVTYNLPSEVTEEQVSSLYMEAWKLGLKGFTVYRDDCREGILTTDKSTRFNQYDAPKRPKDLACDVYNIMAKGRPWKVFIGIMEGLPYEVFAVNGKIDKVLIEHGVLRKVIGGRYDLLSLTGETIVEDITHNMTQEEEAFTRIISWALRHGAKLQFGVEQLNKAEGDITSFAKAIARTFKKYIKDGSIIRGDACPTCSMALVTTEGCAVCHNCGYSKCL